MSLLVLRWNMPKTKSKSNRNTIICIKRAAAGGSDSCLRLFCLDYLTKRAVLAVHLCKVVLVHIQIGLLRHGDAAMT